MMRMKPIADAKAAVEYFAVSDGGYYHEGAGLHAEWGGKGAAKLNLSGKPQMEQFERLVHGLDPHTGDQLTAKLIENRIPAWDITASVPKSVTTLLECGDDRVQGAIWNAFGAAMQRLETYATTRVRVDGQQADRVTGNLIWYAVEHADTRPVEDESLPEGHRWRVMPDWDRHIHGVVMNLNFDEVEDKWKAVKFRPIMDLRRFFDRSFDALLAKELTGLGYEIETRFKADAKGGAKYFTWDVKGLPASLIAKNSRRTAEVDRTEAAIVAAMKEQHGDHIPDHLSAVARDQLGATSRRQKRDDLTLEECREFWRSRIDDDEARQVEETINRARQGLNARSELTAENAVAFSLAHHSEQLSVIRYEELAATALERCLGAASPADIDAEIHRQAIVAERDGKKWVTTEELIREEDYLARQARPGRGVTPLGVPEGLNRGRLNQGQWKAVCGLLNSASRVGLIEGPAGAGKSSLLKKFDEGVQLQGGQVTYLATTAKAAEVLQNDGFDARTLVRFLIDEKLQRAAKGGRVVIDESSMLGHKDAVKLYQLAEKLDLKLIHVADQLQHGSVARGAFPRLLKEYAGISPFKLTEIMRQKDDDYRAAAKLLSEGETQAGFDAIDRKGWVQEIEGDDERYARIAADYLDAVKAKESVLIVSPTHAEAARIDDAVRSSLRAAGKLGTNEREFTRLVAADASEAERGRAETYQGDWVIQFHRAAKGFKAGERLTASDGKAVPLSEAGKFQLYRREQISLSVGDKIRFTAPVASQGGTVKFKNGSVATVAGFDRRGNIHLEGGTVIDKAAGHYRRAFVETSYGSQGQTVDRVILGLGSASVPAMSQEQLYVSATRGTRSVRIYTDDKEAIRDAVMESSQKLAALDLKVNPPAPPEPSPRPVFLDRVKQWVDQRRRNAAIDRTRSAWEPVRKSSPALSPAIMGHADRYRAEQRGNGYER